jgi:D-serine deaminase-like pyridoxal phosphate-dependent protein
VQQLNDKGPNAHLIGVPGGAAKVVTPALMIDVGRLRANLKLMKDQCTQAGLKLRPHGKTHKCSRLAREQLDHGADGVCCATAHEAIAFAGAGISGILLTAPVVQPWHLKKLVELHGQDADITVVVDHPDGIAAWEAALTGSSRPMPALIDIDIGMGRTGASTVKQVLTLAELLQSSRMLKYAGVQAYSGRVQHINNFEERRSVYLRQLDRLEASVHALHQAGFAPAVVSGGGTGTFAVDVERRLYTETQVGSYVFMDVEYNAVELFSGTDNPYATSLFMRTSIISNNVPGQATLNAGFKSFATDGPVPELFGEAWEGARYEFFGDEYGRLLLPSDRQNCVIGSMVDVVTPHCDPTVNLHDYYHIIEDGTLVDIWLIDGRGVL